MNVEDQVARREVMEQDTLLRGFLGEFDEPCPLCEYNLRGLTGTVCPECGETLRLRVSLSEPKMAAYLCGLIGLSVGVGFSGIMIALFVVIALLFYRGGPFFGWMFVVLLVQFVIEGLAMWLWLARRSWIRRRSRGQRWALVAAAWGCSIGFTVLLFTVG